MGRTLIAFITIFLVGFGSNTASSQTKKDTLKFCLSAIAIPILKTCHTSFPLSRTVQKHN